MQREKLENPQEKQESPPVRTPAGFTPHSGGLASEYAREMGWGLNEPERAKEPEQKQDADGGTNYDYGAADFGDTAKDTNKVMPPAVGETKQTAPVKSKPPIIIVKADTKPAPRFEQKPRKRIA